MKIRAHVTHIDEFWFPDGETALDLSLFFGILHGLDIKKKEYKINQYTGLKDVTGEYIFTDDVLRIDWRDDAGTKSALYFESEAGYVTFADSMFVVRNHEGMEIELGFGDLQGCNFTKIGTIYDEGIKDRIRRSTKRISGI